MGALMALFWGFIGGVSLLLGALLGLFGASQRVISLVMATGAGVLISSVAFELMDTAFRAGGFGSTALGMAGGSLTFFAADVLVSRAGGKHRKRSQGQQQGGNATAIAIGALLDGIPESMSIGIGLLGGRSVSLVMVAAVFLSNVPESLSAASGMKKAGHSTRFVLLLWSSVVVISAVSAWIGYVALAGVGAQVLSAIQAFAAGAILTMLSSTMLPEAYESGGAVIGVLTALGFLAAFALGHAER
jgi:ZIP family zinc transporter